MTSRAAGTAVISHEPRSRLPDAHCGPNSRTSAATSREQNQRSRSECKVAESACRWRKEPALCGGLSARSDLLRPVRSGVPRPKYPFEPKSNAYLLPGQFWGVPLSDGRWACGRVLAVKTEPGACFPGNSRTFLAALMCWQGDVPPTAEAIAGRQVLAQGWARIRSVQRNGQMIIGCRDLGLDGIRGLREVTHRGGGTVMLYEGATPLWPATRAEAASMPVMSTWGLRSSRCWRSTRRNHHRSDGQAVAGPTQAVTKHSNASSGRS